MTHSRKPFSKSFVGRIRRTERAAAIARKCGFLDGALRDIATVNRTGE